jgi:hypothetical protein
MMAQSESYVKSAIKFSLENIQISADRQLDILRKISY